MKPLIAFTFALLLMGCAGTDYKDYLSAQRTATADHKPQPLFVMEGYEGQPITGLKRVEINMPTSAPVIQQAKDNEWAGVFRQGLGVVGAVGGIWAGGEAAKGLAGAVGNAANHGYQYVQTPQANVTTTTSTTTDSHNTTTDSHAITGSYNPATTDNSNQGNPATTQATPLP